MNIPSVFKNAGHFIAASAKRFVGFVHNDLDPALAKIQASKETIEAVTRIVSPQAAMIEDAAFFALGAIGEALDAVAGAVDAKGLNVTLDQTAVDKLKSAISIVKQSAPKPPAPAPMTTQELAAATIAPASA